MRFITYVKALRILKSNFSHKILCYNQHNFFIIQYIKISNFYFILIPHQFYTNIINILHFFINYYNNYFSNNVKLQKYRLIFLQISSILIVWLKFQGIYIFQNNYTFVVIRTTISRSSKLRPEPFLFHFINVYLCKSKN